MATGQGDEPLNERDGEEWGDARARSILSTTWFRVLAVVLVIGAAAAVAIPYVMKSRQASPPVAGVPATPPKQEVPSVAPTTVPSPPAAPAERPSTAAPPTTQSQKPGAARPPAGQARKSDAARSAAKSVPAPRPQAVRAATTTAGSGDLWVQVGAFRDEGSARRLAAALREQGFNVVGSATAPAAGAAPTPAPAAGKTDRYDVVVSGAAATDLGQKVTAKGLSAERSGDGAVIRPSLPLRDAVSLSNDLRAEGFKVTVRRVGGTTSGVTTPAVPGAAPAAPGETLHRVRVGTFPDRAATGEAVRKLEALGYRPFIARDPN